MFQKEIVNEKVKKKPEKEVKIKGSAAFKTIERDK